MSGRFRPGGNRADRRDVHGSWRSCGLQWSCSAGGLRDSDAREHKGDYRTVTNREGSYVLTGLRPGEYIVTFELAGFSRLDRAGVRLEVNEQSRVDVVMQVGALSDAVTVVGDASVVQTSNATLQTVVDSRRLVDLPLNGRQALQLQALTPGVVQVNEGRRPVGLR